MLNEKRLCKVCGLEENENVVVRLCKTKNMYICDECCHECDQCLKTEAENEMYLGVITMDDVSNTKCYFITKNKPNETELKNILAGKIDEFISNFDDELTKDSLKLVKRFRLNQHVNVENKATFISTSIPEICLWAYHGDGYERSNEASRYIFTYSSDEYLEAEISVDIFKIQIS